MKITYKLLAWLALGIFTCIDNPSFAQQDAGSIKGKVTDAETGEILPGASIKIKHSTNGTFADQKGLFELHTTVSADTVVISYIGYLSSEIALATVRSNFLDVRLGRRANQMKEIVVSTGYQNLPQERATGAFATVDNTLLNRRVSSDVISKLEDVTSGLLFDRRFSGQPSLNIRGRSTILAQDQPLIVVDNFPYNGDLNDLNPNDIDKVTVLKDAAAASIWGARAGNGVIVITTKHGRNNQQLRMEFNANFTIGQKPNLSYNPNFMNSSDFIGVEQKLFGQGFYDADLSDPTYPVISPVVQLLNEERNGTVDAATANARINALKGIDVRNDFAKYFYRQSKAQQYAFNVSGGSNNASYFFSTGYDRNLDNLVGNQGRRVTLNSSTNIRLLNHLELSSSLAYTGSSQQNNNPGEMGILSGGPYGKSLYPYAQLADAAGNPLPVAKDYNPDFVSTAQSNGYLDWRYRPLQELRLANNVNDQNDIRLNTSLKYEFTDNLNAVVSYNFQRVSSRLNIVNSDSSYYARDLINQYTQNDGSGNLTYPIPFGGIFDQTRSDQVSHQGRTQLNFDQVFNRKHRISTIAGFEVSQVHSTGNTYRLYGYDGDVLNYQPINETDYFNLSPSENTQQIPTNYSLADQTDRYLSYFANASYAYDTRYIVSASARKDESNLFGVKTNQKGVPLWSAGLGWIISGEPGYHLSALPYLKLRATYGHSGNVVKTVTAYTIATYSNDPLTGLPNATILSPPNPSLKWETIGMLNLGLDFETAGRRFSGSIEYFHKNGYDLIGDAPLDPTTGFFIADRYSFRGNNANIKGHGFDLNLNSVNIAGKFRWQTHYLFSYANMVVSKYNYQQAPSNYFTLYPPPRVGYPQFSIYSFKSAGLDPQNGNPRVYHNGAVTEDYSTFLSGLTLNDLVYNGPALPPYFGSVRNTFSYGNFEASFNISFKFGYYFRRSSINYYNLDYYWQGNRDFSKRWQQPGDEAHTIVPSIPDQPNYSRDAVYLSSNSLVDKGDNIRFQDFSLSYRLTREHLRQLPFSQVQIYGYANNLGIIWRANHDHLDPDFSSQPYPLVRTFSLGVKANF